MTQQPLEYFERQPERIGGVLLKLRCGDTVGVANIYADRIETWRNDRMIGKARSIDDALRQAINAENRELKRRK